MDEFAFIAHTLAPLAEKETGALGLKDDAALLSVLQGHELIVTKDALVEGVHFMGDESPALIAQKALRVNLSDCAAMGAKPHAYMLALMVSEATEQVWLQEFAEGLQKDQATFGVNLIGGDTTHTYGSFALSITLFGLVPEGSALRRSGAKVGDGVYVSGTIGDAALGLSIARHDLTDHSPLKGNEFLLGRYQLPEPRLALGQKLRGIASSCIDVSDGLVQDMGHICECSGVGATLDWQAVPLSDAAKAYGYGEPEVILAGGDDYELLFTLPPEKEEQMPLLQAIMPITRIGTITQEKGVRVLDGRTEMKLTRKGYVHF